MGSIVACLHLRDARRFLSTRYEANVVFETRIAFGTDVFLFIQQNLQAFLIQVGYKKSVTKGVQIDAFNTLYIPDR